MFLGILTLLVALCISGIAAYYSIIGLTAIFAAAFLPIVLMGSVLEVGKILTTVWLHQNWHRAPKIIRTYLTTAVIVLMFITSMGVFGFLSKSHIEQSAVGTEQLAQANVINDKISRSEAKINRWKENIQRLSDGNTSSRVDALISREQQRIKDAADQLQPQIDAENAKISRFREQAQREIDQQNKRLDDARSRTNDDVKLAQQKLAQLDKDVEAYTKKGVIEGTFSNDDLVAKGAELRLNQKPQRDAIQKDIDKARANELGVANKVQQEISKINDKLSEQIKQVERNITQLRQSIKPIVNSVNANIAKYTNDTNNVNKNIDKKIKELEENINSEQPIIDKLREDKFVFEKNYRKFEAEVGPVKYIAELIYGQADHNLLEAAVRWVIIIIVAVFDPLAVCLVLAGTMTITWWRTEKNKKTSGNLDTNVSKIVEVKTQPDPRVEELEMELKKHNEILDELEKLLDSNLGNVNPLEYQKLQDEYAALLSERTELEAQLVTQKEQTELLVDKVVETESERDNYKKKIDELSTGVEGFTARIEELLKRITELETEVERRDAVVIKMAEKYQLVEKDEFGEDLIAEATEKTKK